MLVALTHKEHELIVKILSAHIRKQERRKPRPHEGKRDMQTWKVERARELLMKLELLPVEIPSTFELED